jgi:quinol monooxygenase YgiN
VSDLDVVAVLTARPGSEDPMREALTALVEPTRAEAGCLSYDLYASNSEPTVFITIEKWRSQEDLDAHMQTEHIQNALATARDHFAAAPAVHPLTRVVVGN